MVNHVIFDTRHQTKLATFDYIEGWYNRWRKHSTLNYQTPPQCESYFLTSSMAAQKILQYTIAIPVGSCVSVVSTLLIISGKPV